MERDFIGGSAQQSVIVFSNLKQVNDEASKLFNAAKKNFYEDMDSYFSMSVDGSSFEFDDEKEDEKSHYKVTQCRKVSTDWDVKGLRKALGSHASEVLSKHYELIDFEGLAAYVKSLGGEAKLFKSFFSVTESVDTAVLDNLSEVGEVDADEVADCCNVRLGKPWYKVSVKHGV